jgi:hypothetical protein
MLHAKKLQIFHVSWKNGAEVKPPASSTWQKAKSTFIGWSSLGLLAAAANNNNLSRGGLEITPIKFYVAIKGIFMCAHQQVI